MIYKCFFAVAIKDDTILYKHEHFLMQFDDAELYIRCQLFQQIIETHKHGCVLLPLFLTWTHVAAIALRWRLVAKNTTAIHAWIINE